MPDAGINAGSKVALTLLCMSEVPNFYSGALPSLFTISTFTEAESEHTRYWIRRGEIVGFVLSLGVGLATSVLADSPLPLLGSLVMSGILLYQYEHALRNGAGTSMLAGARDDV